MNTNPSFTILGTVDFSEKRSIVISRRSQNYYWLNERIESEQFRGFTYKGFGFRAEDMTRVADALRGAVSAEGSFVSDTPIGGNKFLRVARLDNGLVDVRQYLYADEPIATRKGVQCIVANARKLIEGLERAGNQTISAPTTTSCLHCGTVKRPIYRDALCFECYSRENKASIDTNGEAAQTTLDIAETWQSLNQDHLQKAFDLHGRRCYVCQSSYRQNDPSFTLYYADNDPTNDDENNMFPICQQCLEKMPT